jgi:hypothetical protein
MLLGLVVLGIALFVSFGLVQQREQPVAPPKRQMGPYVPPKGYVCYRASSPIKIDGRLDDPAWQAAPWTEDFVEIQGDGQPAPRYRTRVKMLWDDDCLYIAAELEEPHVWATQTKHDSYIFKYDNDFEVFLSPEGDSHLYAELEMNALNTTWDLLVTRPYKDGGRGIDAWDITGLRTAVHVDGTINDPSDRDRGWTIEIAWPWNGLTQLTSWDNSPRSGESRPRGGDQWRINFSRVQWDHDIVEGKYRKISKEVKDEANWVWSPQGEVNMHMPERWGYVQFSTAAPGSATFQPDTAGPAKHLLHEVYRAQHDYRKKHGTWARDLKSLNFANLGPANLLDSFRMETTESLFEASVRVSRSERWHIRQDARIWAD